MANETQVTLIGNLTSDPELRFVPSGEAVASFSVASTPRFFDRQANEFKDAETLFLRCSVWREYAENVAESLTRGSAVIVQGRLKSKSFETKEGEKRTVMEVDVDEVGPSLRRAKAVVTKTNTGQGKSQGQPQGPPQGQGYPQPVGNGQGAQQGAWGQSSGDGGWGNQPR